MAEAFAKLHGKDKINAYSAGSKPSGKVNPRAIEALKEKGIDISLAQSNGFERLRDIKFDYVISMGCKDQCPFVPSEKKIDWQIPDPKDQDMNFFRKVRDTDPYNPY